MQWDTDSDHVYRTIFDNLVTHHADGKIVPQVASAWTYRTPTEIEFTIRTDIKFHDGTKLTPEDVVYSVRIPSPANPPGGGAFHTRCPFAVHRCRHETPALTRKSSGADVACHLAD